MIILTFLEMEEFPDHFIVSEIDLVCLTFILTVNSFLSPLLCENVPDFCYLGIPPF